jgi:LysR family transcriptional regulator, glycine cleavage system transcriptional activator
MNVCLAMLEPLFGEALIPVASPRLPRIKHLKEPKDLLAFPLLHEITRPWAWNRWLEQEGVALEHSLPGARFDQFNMVVEAAMACLGIALVPQFRQCRDA